MTISSTPITLQHATTPWENALSAQMEAAIATNDPGNLDFVLALGADPDGTSSQGHRWILFATLLGFAEGIELLAQAGAPCHGQIVPFSSNNTFTTPLHQAVKHDRPDLIGTLIDSGADPEELDSEGFTAMSLSKRLGRFLCSTKLAIRGARLDAPDPAHESLPALAIPVTNTSPPPAQATQPRSPAQMLQLNSPPKSSAPTNPQPFGVLVAACAKGDVGKLTEALTLYADHLDKKIPSGQGLLFLAAQSGANRCVEMLLEAGIDPDQADREGWSVAIHAAKNGWAECLRLCLRHGADANYKSPTGDTALHWSARNRHRACSRLLLQAGADTTLIDPSLTGAQIQRWADAILAGAFELMEEDVEALNFLPPDESETKSAASIPSGPKPGTDAKRIEDANYDLLTYAWKGRLDLVENALSRGADPNFASDMGQSALCLASERGKLPVLLALIEAGARIDFINQDGMTPFDISARHGRFACLNALASAGHPVDHRDAKGTSALFRACWRKDFEVARHLLSMGANPYLRDAQDRTVFVLACQTGDTVIIDKLLSIGLDPRPHAHFGFDVFTIAVQSDRSVLAQMLLARQEAFDLRDASSAGKATGGSSRL